MALERLGAQVSRVENGAKLIESLAEKTFDLIVTDVSMPWMSGLQVALSARNARIATPLIIMTASRRDGLAEQVEALGQHTFLLRKPFDMAQLIVAFKRMVS